MHESTAKHIEIPPEFLVDPDDDPLAPRRVTAEELEHRRIVVERILKRRERIGNIGIHVEDLLGRHFDESDI